MSRWWTEFVAAVSDLIPLGLLVLLMFVAAAVTGALWYWFPAWVPRRWPHLRRPRWRRPRWRWRWPRWGWLSWRLRWPRWSWAWLQRLRWPGWRSLFRWLRRRRPAEAAPEPLAAPSDELPDLPVEAFAALADRLAAQGRYAEAVRERLRAIVRDLVDRGVIEHHPGWTVTELARAAAGARPAVSVAMHAAGSLFSDIWYGQRPAGRDDDVMMRRYGEEVHAALDRPRGLASAAAGGSP